MSTSTSYLHHHRPHSPEKNMSIQHGRHVQHAVFEICMHRSPRCAFWITILTTSKARRVESCSKWDCRWYLIWTWRHVVPTFSSPRLHDKGDRRSRPHKAKEMTSSSSTVQHKEFFNSRLPKLLRFRSHKLLFMMKFINFNPRTSRRRYKCYQIIAMCTVLTWLAFPSIWWDLESFFGMMSPSLLDVSWESF